jgi:hypothetical protein
MGWDWGKIKWLIRKASLQNPHDIIAQGRLYECAAIKIPTVMTEYFTTEEPP